MQTVKVDQLAFALAQCVRDGVKLENERITKLLLTTLEEFDCDQCGECVTPKRLVELIKEETE